MLTREELYIKFDCIVSRDCIDDNVKNHGLYWTYNMLSDIKRKI